MTNTEPERICTDKSEKPTDETLRTGLGKAFAHYNRIGALAPDFVSEWNFSKSSGWMLKYHDKKKALFYLIPLRGAIKISLTLRENERELFLTKRTLDTATLDKIESAKKYSEGYGIHFMIISAKDYGIFRKLIEQVMAIRRKG